MVEPDVNKRSFGLAAVMAAALAMPSFARGAPDSFADLSAKLLPTVVNIAAMQTMKGGQKSQVPDLPPALQDMFRDFLGGAGAPRRITSVGSGFVIDQSGLIVTNNHVVAGAAEVAVTFNNGETYRAKLIGRDEKTDLALLKIAPKRPLAAAHFGDSNRARIGDWVIAIGNPFGLGSTVTAGIVSARNRDIESGPYDDFIQTDAPINKGNSGGPLFDMDGNVVGINSAIFSPTGGSVGIGFAIPANLARDVIDNLRRFGRVNRGWVGVNIQPAKGGGAAITSVAANGPAARAGIRPGDVVFGFDGKKISDSRALARIAAGTAPGKTVNVDIRRGGKHMTLRLAVQLLK
jgi:serine protease Do